MKRAFVFEINQCGNTTRHRQYNHQQQDSIQEIGPCGQGRGNFRQQSQNDGSEQGANNGAAPANQDGYEKQNRKFESKRIRRDIGLQACK